jgi:hypothetical protein
LKPKLAEHLRDFRLESGELKAFSQLQSSVQVNFQFFAPLESNDIPALTVVVVKKDKV